MHFIIFLTAALGLGAGVLASPALVPNSLKARDESWHGCAQGIECHSDDDCQGESDCVQMAIGHGVQVNSNVHCGQDGHPVACWARW
ncbi:hypothetical protein BO70DRAFT_429664 [Aspergillus heteromorphus CBS 117.55]|uniref:Uncharacterized protein n=1 Tax=Aspergillus heteromorphus CBS 117.55 TaxID=1448321 RepID=A0A317W6K9_9EURO|nr:uncharacterized protein BO70DRAFT_429664 [Aspergillus heteromorphus CBS 117.55]PWY80638.1 hypothetical protein BO70DRAFT_429664 [Aspergillus heteromorphus CBS 117.55]